MLILTRRTHQSITVGSDIFVTVLAVQGGQVRLGIKAPRYIPVHREEVAKRVRQKHSDAHSRKPMQVTHARADA
jgi:carbon storage regulator